MICDGCGGAGKAEDGYEPCGQCFGQPESWEAVTPETDPRILDYINRDPSERGLPPIERIAQWLVETDEKCTTLDQGIAKVREAVKNRRLQALVAEYDRHASIN